MSAQQGNVPSSRICYETCINNGYLIRLEQARRTSLFCVTYGKQVDDGLTYGRACSKLGEAIMHALACEGKLDNGGK